MAALEANHASETVNGLLLCALFVELVKCKMVRDRQEDLKDLIGRWFIVCPLQVEQENLWLVGDIHFS